MALHDDIVEQVERALNTHFQAGFEAGAQAERAKARLVSALEAREVSLLELGKEMYSAGLEHGQNRAANTAAAPSAPETQSSPILKAQHARTRLMSAMGQDLNRTRLSNLPIGTRAKRVLAEAGITTVGRLRRKTHSELLRMHGLGPRSVGPIVAELKKLGIVLED